MLLDVEQQQYLAAGILYLPVLLINNNKSYVKRALFFFFVGRSADI